MSEQLRWSPHPITRYTRVVDGRPIGPGVNPGLIGSPGAWNLYWLAYPDLEMHTDLDLSKPPLLIDPMAPIMIETAQQYVAANRVSDLAVNLSPDAFISLMDRSVIGHLAATEFFGRKLWLGAMRHRAFVFSGARRSDLDFDLTPQKNGTNQEDSTNMLPLVQYISRLIH